ncbi:MAG: hypothetical protein BWX71_02544 [Deltaproteobacteria bacterium ADurb.Bin072]|nr:MAG: hypothetical protein BWX71_02544 [Deltaproteobacteria bacterium ADurb.Bin072]
MTPEPKARWTRSRGIPPPKNSLKKGSEKRGDCCATVFMDDIFTTEGRTSAAISATQSPS